MSGFVYVIRSSNGLYKVGYSSDPRKRLTMLRTSTADDLTLLGVTAGTMADEARLHAEMAQHRVAREWFKFSRRLEVLISTLTPLASKVASEIDHPVTRYAATNGVTVADIAKSAKCSRMTLYRVMRGENATTDLVQRICDATGGKVSPSAFFPKRETAA